MTDSHRALCSDFYINFKLGVKMELPRKRETVLELFERLRRRFPAMHHFRPLKDELALESPSDDPLHRWVAVKATSLRAGVVNPPSMAEAYDLHNELAEAAPYFLSISGLDVEFVELLYGFDLECGQNHDAVIYEALVGDSPLAGLLDREEGTPLDCQPVMGFSFGEKNEYEAHFEVKSRSAATLREGESRTEPISVYQTVRRVGGVGDIRELPGVVQQLAERGERLLEQRSVPSLLVPLRNAIAFGSL